MAVVSTPACAQQASYGDFRFTVPPGFERNTESWYERYVKFNPKHTAYAEFVLYKSRPGTADVKAEFRKDWHEYIQQPTAVAAPEPQAGKADNGWAMVYGIAPIRSPQGDYSQTLLTRAGHGQVASVSVRFTDLAFAPDVKQFLGSLEMLKPSPPPPASPPTQAKGQSAVVGVWWGFGESLDMMSYTDRWGTGGTTVYSTSFKVKQIAFLADGSFCYALPLHGLADWQAERAKTPDYWGTYRFTGGAEGQIVSRTGALVEPFRLTGASVLLYHKVAYKRIPPRDHLRLQGTYTAERDPNAWRGSVKVEPVVTFAPDGTFNDQGAFYYIRHVRGYDSDTQDNAYGSGRYDIADYTITFTYTDGRVIKMTFLYLDETGISLALRTLTKKP
jgi:hypothetical protein